VSLSSTCGVRAHAGLLAEALEREGMACSTHWLMRGEPSLLKARSEVSAWNARLALEFEESRPDLVLLHYSVFSYSFRGVPVFVHPTLSLLRRAGVPVVTVMHEFAYPWFYGGWRGAAWAVSQRALLIDVMRVSAGAIVTAPERAAWLASRAWLPRRPVAMAPVFSNLPAPDPLPAAAGGRGPLVGLFGYSYQGAAVSVTLDALAILRGEGIDVQLRLLGAPGRASSAGEAWLEGARTRGLQERLSFSGALGEQELSNALAACDVLLFIDTAGPSSRKGTLAGSLASGTPVVALDGPRRWPELVQGDAARVAEPTPQGFAAAIRSLLADEGARDALGRRGRQFAEQRMGIARTVDAVTEMLELLSARHSRDGAG
jgi:glycosyltransferase involved in cell wall biosynthesis